MNKLFMGYVALACLVVLAVWSNRPVAEVGAQDATAVQVVPPRTDYVATELGPGQAEFSEMIGPFDHDIMLQTLNYNMEGSEDENALFLACGFNLERNSDEDDRIFNATFFREARFGRFYDINRHVSFAPGVFLEAGEHIKAVKTLGDAFCGVRLYLHYTVLDPKPAEIGGLVAR